VDATAGDLPLLAKPPDVRLLEPELLTHLVERHEFVEVLRLAELGLRPRKTFDSDFPDYLPDDLIPHWLRGSTKTSSTYAG
jgi:hypothetical protein